MEKSMQKMCPKTHNETLLEIRYFETGLSKNI